MATDTETLTQREAALLLKVSVSYLRASDCPKLLLPGRGTKPLVRYDRAAVLAWRDRWSVSATTPQTRLPRSA